MPIPAVGTPAQDVTLNATGGTTVSRSSHRGSSDVLLAFFPLAFTSV